MLFSLPKADFSVPEIRGTRSLKTSLEISNYISKTTKDGDTLYIDGESLKIQNKLSYQYSKQVRVAINTSWIKHSDGISDRFIYHFHDLLGLPQNGRSDAYHDQLYWRFYSDNETVLSLDQERSSWGDTELSLTWQPQQLERTQLNLMLKLPSGSYTNQTGSEGIDIGFSLTQQNPEWLSDRTILEQQALAFWYGAGLGFTSHVSKLSKFDQNPINFSLRTGLAWLVSADWELKTQLDTHSPLFNTELRELGWFPLQFTLASEHHLTAKTSLSFMIVEDLRPRSAPDVIFNTSLALRF